MTKRKFKTIFWILLSIGTGIFLSSFILIFFKNVSYSRNIKQENLTANTIQTKEEKQKYFYINKGEEKELNIKATSYLVGDLNTGEVILSGNQDAKLPIASVSKLMTALVATEITDRENIAEISKSAVATHGDNGNLKIGEKIQTQELLYPLLLESSNDAAEAIAEHFGRDNFIKKMNEVAKVLDMSSTSYEDPSGLSPNNQSSVADLFKLVGYLNKEKKNILEITDKRSYSNKKHSWSNISQFLHKEGYFGGKSGYTDAAKQTVISLFSLPLGKENGRPIAIILLGSPNRNNDVQNILKYLKKNVYYGGIDDASTDWVKNKIMSPEIKDPDYLIMTFVGDIMLDRGVRNSVIKNFDNDYSALFENLEILKESDVVFGNLEGTASDKGRDGGSLYSFHMDPAVVPTLSGAGFNVLSVANNHVGDWGRIAYTDTLSRLKENEILYTGGGNNIAEAEAPAIIEKYGMKIGFLGFSDKGPDWLKATENNPGLLIASNPRFDEIIQNASKQVDYLVVSFHFGEEYQNKHNERQEYLAHKAVDAGAKFVIGAHPHVIEDTEIYKNSYIAYSLGNFIFDQSWSEPTMKGMLLKIKLNRDGTMSIQKNTVQLNKAFQPEKLLEGKEEEIIFK